MSGANHAERGHALLGASKASQWINCPPSARLQESVPDVRSEYANEGTVAHELAEVKLRQRVTICDSEQRVELAKQQKLITEKEYYCAEMENAIQEYVAIVEERYLEAKKRSSDAVILLEDQLDFSEWVPDGYGTGDVVIIADGTLEVIDLKYGKGVPVSAIDNPQLRLYGLGAWASWDYLYDIRMVSMTIIQPRLESVSTDLISVDDLLEWAENVVQPAAALAFEGKGDLNPGDHCRWCKVKATCRARAEANLKAVEYEFQDPALMSDEEIGSVLYVAEQLAAWAKDVQTYAFEQAKAGRRIPQWKLVEGRSNRSIADKDAAQKALLDSGYKRSQILKPQELLGIGELEKVVGKKELTVILDGFIQKPPGKPVLVPETDARPELNSIDSDFANEDFEA